MKITKRQLRRIIKEELIREYWGQETVEKGADWAGEKLSSAAEMLRKPGFSVDDPWSRWAGLHQDVRGGEGSRHLEFLRDSPDLVWKLIEGIDREIGNDMEKRAELWAVVKEMGSRGQLQAIFERVGGEEAGIGAILDSALTQLQYM